MICKASAANGTAQYLLILSNAANQNFVDNVNVA
jgi:hypothetical protein